MVPDVLWGPLVAVAVVCAGTGYVIGMLVGQDRAYRRGHREGVALGWEARGQARHEGAVTEWRHHLNDASRAALRTEGERPPRERSG